VEVIDTQLPDVKIVVPKRFSDPRGFFSEVYKRNAFASAGIDSDFLQDNHSLSGPVGTLRGLHFQTPPFAQAKLVRVLRGSIFDVAVDIRHGSPHFGRVASAELSAANGKQLFVPRGFAHGFVTLEPDTEVLYKVDSYYAPENDSGIIWNDPDIAIDWPLPDGGPVLSDKDGKLGRLADIKPVFHYESNLA
jgi:dTDP-4-dehydrorhamnose 3,5-epimerase